MPNVEVDGCHVLANARGHGGPLGGILGLYNGRKQTPIVKAVPDDHWLGMYRLVWPDGKISDMANLTRIKDAGSKDAAYTLDSQLLHWKPLR